MYKLIAADMDGTVLTTDGKISQRNVECIRQAEKTGVKFVLSSGRSVKALEKYRRVLNISSPVICYNGAVSVWGDEVLFERKLERVDAEKILKLGDLLSATMCIWSDEKLYTNTINDKLRHYESATDTEAILISDYNGILEQGIIKILWYEDLNRIEEIREVLERETFHSVAYCTSNPVFMEFFNAEASKGEALLALCERFSIDISETIAIGDGENDLSMIETAGLGIAMNNAPNSVKEKAEYITASNDEDGVAKVIEKFIFTKNY